MRNPAWTVGVALLFGACLGAATPPTPPEPPMGTLHILVVDLELVPIPNANLTIRPGDLLVPVSPTGEATITLAPGAYQLNASAPRMRPNATDAQIEANGTHRLTIVLEHQDQVYFVPRFDGANIECGTALRNRTLDMAGECQTTAKSSYPAYVEFSAEANFSSARFVFEWGEAGSGQQMLVRAGLRNPQRPFPDGRASIDAVGRSPLELSIEASSVDALLAANGRIRLHPHAPSENEPVTGLVIRVQATFINTHVAPASP